MADPNRLPEAQRPQDADKVNENADMTDGSSHGTAPASGDGPEGGTYGPQGGSVQGGDTSAVPNNGNR